MRMSAEFRTTISVEKQDGTVEKFGLSAFGQGFTEFDRNADQSAENFKSNLADVFDFQDSPYTERTLANFKGLVRSEIWEISDPQGFGFTFNDGKGNYRKVTFFVQHRYASPDYVKRIMKQVEKIVPEEIPSE